MELVLIFTSIFVIWLIKKCVFSGTPQEQYVPLIYRQNICHCELWHKCSRSVKVGWHIHADTRAEQSHEIWNAFHNVELSVESLSNSGLQHSVSGENILRNALKRMTGADFLIKHVDSAIQREHTFVAGCLKKVRPIFAPTVDPGRDFVSLFCQNLKNHNDLVVSLAERSHHMVEYSQWVFKRCTKLTQKTISKSSKLQTNQLEKLDKELLNVHNLTKEITLIIDDFKKQLSGFLKKEGWKNIIAIDTEMVGAGYRGCIHMLARVSLVNKKYCIYDKYVKPRRPVTDYRTPLSGIREEDLLEAEDFETVQQEVVDLINNSILVGHDLNRDLSILALEYSSQNTRDTAMFLPFRTVPHEKPSLKFLAKRVLHRDIQSGEHSSVEDARAAMDLYLKVADAWEVILKY